MKNLFKKWRKLLRENEDYWMGHRPSKFTPLHDMTTDEDGEQAIPEDFYTHPHYYANMSATGYKESFQVILNKRGKPNDTVVVYRSSPKDILNTGDWITLSEEYAIQDSLYEDNPVHAYVVKVSDVWWAGDDMNEFGYWGEKVESQERIK